MRVERKVFRLEVFRRLIVGEVIEQDRAEDGALRFDVCRERADETVIGSSH